MLKIDDKSLLYRATNRRNDRVASNFPPFCQHRSAPEVLSLSLASRERDRDAVVLLFWGFPYVFVFAVFCAAKIMKRLVSGQVKVFSIFKGCGLINEVLYKPRFTATCNDQKLIVVVLLFLQCTVWGSDLMTTSCLVLSEASKSTLRPPFESTSSARRCLRSTNAHTQKCTEQDAVTYSFTLASNGPFGHGLVCVRLSMRTEVHSARCGHAQLLHLGI
jgi:hypothetical protein